MFKVKNGQTRTMCEICSKLIIKTLQWRCSAVFIVNFGQISHIVLVFLMLTLNNKCRLGTDQIKFRVLMNFVLRVTYTFFDSTSNYCLLLLVHYKNFENDKYSFQNIFVEVLASISQICYSNVKVVKCSVAYKSVVHKSNRVHFHWKSIAILSFILTFCSLLFVNPSVPNAPFLYPLKTSENLMVF